MRVIAGSAKGTRLAPVPAGTRPVSDQAREGLFSSLGPLGPEIRVLDLFAGTGAMGIEALSRGAGHATFVDSSPQAAVIIRENLQRTSLEGRGVVRRGDARRCLGRVGGPFGLVLLDPPYAMEGRPLERLIDELAGQGLVEPGGRLVLTRPKRGYTPVIPLHLSLERRLSYGDTVVLVFRVPEHQ
jgi:16S rRNA (guanine966-N2)-methyltransferase